MQVGSWARGPEVQRESVLRYELGIIVCDVDTATANNPTYFCGQNKYS